MTGEAERCKQLLEFWTKVEGALKRLEMIRNGIGSILYMSYQELV